MQADNIRIATFNAELARKGPGLLLRDIQGGKDPQIKAIQQVLRDLRPDILALQGFDYDLTGLALTAFAQTLADAGLDYPYRFSAQPNTGIQTGLDMNGDGRVRGAVDAQGFGKFTGQGGMAVLSRYPIQTEAVQDFTTLLWRDFPNALLPIWDDGRLFPSDEALSIQRLSTTAHWILPIKLPNGETLHVMTFHASPPVFDGPEDRNGRRNHDEIRFWQTYLDGALGLTPPDNFVIAGDANLDPEDSDGLAEAIRGLLSDPRLQDPRPSSAGAKAAANPGHRADPALDTVDWSDPSPGNLRVDYVLPSASLKVLDAGVYWPLDESIVAAASRHRLVWVDIALP